MLRTSRFRCRVPFLVPVLLLSGNSLALALPIDPAEFPLTTLENFEVGHPEQTRSTTARSDLTTPGLSILGTFTGKFRKIPAAKKELFKRLKQQDPGMLQALGLYQQEIEILEQGRARWIPMQDQLIADLRKEISPNQPITLYLRCIGVAARERVYLIIHFAHGEKRESDHPQASS